MGGLTGIAPLSARDAAEVVEVHLPLEALVLGVRKVPQHDGRRK